MHKTRSAAPPARVAPGDRVGGPRQDAADEAREPARHSAPQSPTSFTWTGLEAGRTSTFAVLARDAADNQSGNSNSVVAKTTPAAAPPTPADLRVTGATPTSITLAWDASAGAASYRIGNGSTTWGRCRRRSPSRASRRARRTRSRCARRTRSPSTRRGAPRSRRARSSTRKPRASRRLGHAARPGSAALSWTASTDDLSAVGYDVEVDGRPARGLLPVSGAPRTVTLEHLFGSETHSFTVRAYDSSGNVSAPGEALVLTMPAGTDTTPPAAPPALRQTGAAGPSSVDLAWGWPATTSA